MYEKLKKLAILLVPKKLLERYEGFFRKLISYKYRGQKYCCNICDFNLKDFAVLSNGNKLCPNCGSLPRTRRLFSIIDSEYSFKKKTGHTNAHVYSRTITAQRASIPTVSRWQIWQLHYPEQKVRVRYRVGRPTV